MFRTIFALSVLYFLSFPLCGQSQIPYDPVKKPGSHLYLPFDFGFIRPLNNDNLSNGFYLSSGIEYRYRKEKGWFARGSWDIYSSKYVIGSNPRTNATKGRLSYNTFLLGGGYRKELCKMWRVYAIGQAGLNFSGYNVIGSNANNYVVNEKGTKCLALKGAVGLEFYPSKDPDFGISLEPVYTVFPSTNVFWSAPNHQFGVKIGINATLF